jgi:serine/threonine protein kinase
VGHALLGSVSTQGSLRRQLPSLLGMPVWMAPPELWTDRTQVTPAADIFCLGALMAWWLTGQHPFGQGMSLEVQNRMLRKQLPGLQTALGRIPASLYQFLEDCLDPNPQLRPPNATLALAREALAEGKEGPLPTVEGGVSLPYSCFFPEAGTLSPGEDLFGLVQESAAPPGGPRGEDTMDPEVQRLLALLPVRDKSTRTPGGKKGRMVSWIAAIVLVLLAVALFPMVLDQLGSAHRPHEGPVPPDAEGLTHDDLWTPGERSESNPTVAYLLSGISHPLKSELTVLGGFWDTPFDLRVPAIPPYSLVSNSASQTMELRFSARNRLDRMILLGPDGKPRIWQLLYDGGGRPKVLRSLSGEVPEWKVLGP